MYRQIAALLTLAAVIGFMAAMLPVEAITQSHNGVSHNGARGTDANGVGGASGGIGGAGGAGGVGGNGGSNCVGTC